jgi:putative transposase
MLNIIAGTNKIIGVGVQKTLSLMGKVRNLFSLEVGRYTKKAFDQRQAFKAACVIWAEVAQEILCV